jgi:FGGY-family pentulose kinase
MKVIGVDVGTRGVRAAVYDVANGSRVGEEAAEPIEVRHPHGHPECYEQSSSSIWSAVCRAVSRVLASVGVEVAQAVVGLGFDATCSLVVGPGICVSPQADPPPDASPEPSDTSVSDVILWLCHRAEGEAAAINATSHTALRTVGGRVSPEMQMPKLLWLKRHRPDAFAAAPHFLDLADFLTHMATNCGDGAAPSRSACTLGCKWNYQHDGWDDDYLRTIGLAEFVADGHARIGPAAASALGVSLGAGLSVAAAAAMGGLRAGIAVSAGAIDAHAGAIGCLGSAPDLGCAAALIGGTSTCVMAHARAARDVRGVWGPYKDGAVPGWFLLEGGQSATGELIDHIINSHAAAADLRAALGAADTPTSALAAELNARALGCARRDAIGDVAGPADLSRVALLARDVHVYPDFAGNRSPLAEPAMRGAVCGLGISASATHELLQLYVAALLALCCQLRHILERIGEDGERITTLCCTGGLASNPLFLALLADATGCELVVAAEPNACTLGSAMLAAVAAGAHADVPAAMRAMTREPTTVVSPSTDQELAVFHAAKYGVYRRMLDDQLAYCDLMSACRATP